MFQTTWMNLWGIMLSELSQRQMPYDLNYKESPKKEKKMELIVENDCQRLEGKGNRKRILKVTHHFHI